MWFEVDKEGLAKLCARRGKVFVIHELLQNCWDLDGAGTTKVTFQPVTGRPLATLTVEDDDPNGFADLAHAYTLFAESAKKSNPNKRGRFNLGEKLVLSLCEEATITSTKGGLRFDRDGRHTLRRRREAGSLIECTIRMTRDEYDEALRLATLVLPPADSRTYLNGERIAVRTPIGVACSVALPTEVMNEDGSLRRAVRETDVRVHRPLPGETPHLFEMGIPVMELPEDDFHISVEQKIPLGLERDAVTPAYLSRLRAYVLGVTHKLLEPHRASATWVNDALGDAAVDPRSVRAVIDKRFGDKAVISDPSDLEGTNMAVAQGYTVVAGGTFPKPVGGGTARPRPLLPAGQVTPSPRPFSPDGEPLSLIPPAEWTPDMLTFADLTNIIAGRCADIDTVTVMFTHDRNWRFNAAYGRDSDRVGHMYVNAGRLGSAFFGPPCRQEQLRLILHELAHHAGHHLEAAYHEALCQMGAALAILARDRPGLFR